MMFKKIPVSIIDKSDEEINYFLEKATYRNFAQDLEELNGHIFLAKKIIDESVWDYPKLVREAIKYMKPCKPVITK